MSLLRKEERKRDAPAYSQVGKRTAVQFTLDLKNEGKIFRAINIR